MASEPTCRACCSEQLADHVDEPLEEEQVVLLGVLDLAHRDSLSDETKDETENQCAPGSTLSELLQEPSPTNMAGVENHIRKRIR